MSNEQAYPIPEPMQAKIMERNEQLLKAQASLTEMVDLARALAGAPDGYGIGDVRIGFVLLPNGEGEK